MQQVDPKKKKMAEVGSIGDLDADIWQWRNENDAMNTSDRGLNRSASLEEKRIGTPGKAHKWIRVSVNRNGYGAAVSFEELLARELAKSQPAEGNRTQEASPTTSGAGGNGSKRLNVQKKPFLKKGERGWWMQRPDVKAKLPKHTLVSKDFDGGEIGSSRATTATASTSMRNSTPASSKRSSRQLLERPQQNRISESSEPKRRTLPQKEYEQLPVSPPPRSPPLQNGDARTPLSPPPPPPGRPFQHEFRRNQIEERGSTARLSDSMRTTGSVDTLGMSGIRQSYEAQLEREADELADFEAIERELAAEKDSYLLEKQQYQRQEVENDRCERKAAPLWHYSSGSQLHQERVSRETSIQGRGSANGSSNLDLDAHSSLLFADEPSFLDDEGKFDSSSQFSSDRRRVSDHFAGNQHPYAASELSAISFNDSESWGDQAPFHQDGYAAVRGSLSPISKLAGASSLLDAAHNDFPTGYGSFGSSGYRRNESDVYRTQDAYGYEDDVRSPVGASKPPQGEVYYDEPPVSALMQQIFGRSQGTPADGEEDEQYDTSHDSDHYRSEVDASTESSMKAQDEIPFFEDVRNSAASGLKSKTRTKQPSESVLPANGKAFTQAARGGRVKAKPSVPSRNPAKGLRSSASKQPNRQSTSLKARTGPILPVAIEEKLFELEEEVKFYKAETLQLQKKKDFYDQEVRKLAKEREEFAKFQSEQGLLIQREWEKERSKMKREEKLMERQFKLKMSAATSHQDRKERGEIEALKAQIVKMQLDEKARANKWKAMNENLRQRVGDLEGKNRELGEEIKFLEKDRLDQWGKYEDLLKEKQQPVESTARAPQKNSYFDLDSEREFRTVNDLFAIKDTAEELLKGWQHRQDGARTQPEYEVDERHRGDRSTDLQASCEGYRAESGGLNRTDSERHGASGDTISRSNPDMLPWESLDSPQGSPKHAEKERESTFVSNSPPSSTGGLSGAKQIDQEIVQPGGKREFLFSDGSKKIVFADGNEKEIESNGHTTIKFTNGDRKELFPDTGISIYYYYEAQTKLTTYPDKTKVYEFPNQQIEKSYPDGTTEISFADGIKKTIRSSGDEFSVFPDGTTMLEQKDGLREVTLLNQKKIRYFPDGEMAWVTPNGKETQVRSDAELKKLMESL